MIRKNIKAAIVAFVVGIFFSISAAAFATTVNSSWKYFGPVLGYNYQNMASAYSDGSGVSASTILETYNGITSVPVGYLGVSANLYDNYGNLVKAIGWQFNNISTYYWSASTAKYYGSGTFYSQAATEVYNGNGYNVYYTYQSPYIQN